jgi:hypothetical protein
MTNEQLTIEESTVKEDKVSGGLNFIGFLVPLIGLIIYLVNRKTCPIKANAVGRAALLGFGISLFIQMSRWFRF